MDAIVPKGVSLDNGLEAWTVTLPRARTAALALFVGVGSRYEPQELNGLSHLLEHALFRGTRRFPSSFAFNARSETCSSGFHAATYRDITTFEASFLPERLEDVLETLAELVGRPLLEDLETERAIILEELGEDKHARVQLPHVDELSKRELFPGSAFGQPVGGTARLVKGFGVGECKSWHARHYAAGNMVLGVAGPWTPEEVAGVAERTLRELPEGPRVEPVAPRVASALPGFAYQVDRAATQTELQLTWVLPEPGHADWPTLRLVLGLLDGGSCGRLQRTLVDERGLCYELGAGLDAHLGLGLLVVDAAVSHAGVAAVIEAALEVVGKLTSEPPSAEEWERLMARVRLDWQLVAETPSSVAFLLAQDRWLGLERPYGELETLMRIRPGDVVAAARRWLRPERLQVATVGKVDGLARARVRRALNRLRAA